MQRRARSDDDLATGAANLLLRVGMIALAVVIPIAAVIHRRPLLVLMPIGAILVTIGSRMAPERRMRTPARLKSAVVSPLGVATLTLVFWAGLSLLWTPFPVLALDRFLKTAGTVLVTLAALASLPKRVRVSNSNLLPIGVAAAAAAIILTAILAPSLIGDDPEVGTVQRATIGAIILLWPALGALATRDRIAGAGLVAISVAIATAVVWMPTAAIALVVAILAFSSAYENPERTGHALGGISAAVILAAPAIALIVGGSPVAHIATTGPFAAIADWSEIIKADGLRLITGHGFDASVRAVLAGRLGAHPPRGLLFEAWYDLGLVGAAATAALAYFAFAVAGRSAGAIAPFLLAALSAIIVLGASGQALSQLWWLTLLCDAAISFAVLTRGQYRAERVAARLSGAEA